MKLNSTVDLKDVAFTCILRKCLPVYIYTEYLESIPGLNQVVFVYSTITDHLNVNSIEISRLSVYQLYWSQLKRGIARTEKVYHARHNPKYNVY